MSIESIVKLYRNIGQEGLQDQANVDYLNSVATIQDSSVQKRLLSELIRDYVILEKRVDSLLKNTLPAVVANEIKYRGSFLPRPYDCTILFSDIVGFTQMAEKMPGEVLIALLDSFFREIDDLIVKFQGTKIKTIGDAYMVVFGAPVELENHAAMAVKAGLALSEMVSSFAVRNNQDIQLRIGIHTGRVMGGVVGRERMQFDVFGDTVNIASRFESSGEKGRVNISHETYVRTRNFFAFEERGEIALKHKDNMKAYFVLRELV
jgi:class 3 adenylate cyclase